MFRGNGDSSDCAELRQQIRLKISNMHQQHSLLKEEVSKRNNSRSVCFNPSSRDSRIM